MNPDEMPTEPDNMAPRIERQRNEFQKELERLINRYSRENGSDTPDFILSGYLMMCLDAFDTATALRDNWNKPVER